MTYRWPTLDPLAQNALLGELAALVAAEQPPDWRQVMLDYGTSAGRSMSRSAC